MQLFKAVHVAVTCMFQIICNKMPKQLLHLFPLMAGALVCSNLVFVLSPFLITDRR